MAGSTPSAYITPTEWDELRQRKATLVRTRKEAQKILRDRYNGFMQRAQAAECFSPTTQLVRFFDTHLVQEHPLITAAAKDFTNGQYLAVQLGTEPIYRLENYGTLKRGRIGPWFRRTIPGSQMQSMSENANFPEWGEYQFLVEYRPPPGQKLIAFEGMNASYAHYEMADSKRQAVPRQAGGFFSGGYNQIYLPDHYRDALLTQSDRITISLFDRWDESGKRIVIPHQIINGRLELDLAALQAASPRIYAEFQKVKMKNRSVSC